MAPSARIGWIVAGAGLLLAGCAASQGQIEQAKGAGFGYDLLAYGAYKREQPERADLHWQQAIDALKSQPKPYLDGALYRDHSVYLANRGWLALERGDVEAARASELQALATVQLGEWQHDEVVAQRQEARQDAIDLARFGALMLLGGFGMFADTAVSLAFGPPQAGPEFGLNPNLPRPIDVSAQGRPLGHVTLPPVDGEATRLPLQAAIGPLSAIGRIEGAAGRCSATLIGQGVAVTTRACATPRTGQSLQVVFETSVAADAVTVVGISAEGAGDAPSGAWTILRLNRHPLRRGWLQPATPAEVADALAGRTRLAVVGYSEDLNDPRFMQMDWGCDAEPGAVAHTLAYACGPERAGSGAAIVALDGAGAYRRLVGLHVTQATLISFATAAGEPRALGLTSGAFAAAVPGETAR